MKTTHGLSVLLLLSPASLAQQVDPATAWRSFQAGNGSGWQIEWDASTGSPAAIWGPGLNGVPELNRSFQVNLTSARENATALLLIGASDTVWNTINLPWDLSPLGATGCKLLVSGEVTLGMTTTNTGTHTQNLNVPNNPSFFGAIFFNQYVIDDKANSFGLVLSNAGKGKVGKQ